MKEIIEKINKLKKQKNAIILAHNYQRDEIQEIADIVGDSFALSKEAKNSNCEVIVFCGVKFMAETAKILSPQKTVLLPNIDAGCPMADMVNENDILNLRNKYPDAAVVCYVNSTAEVKAVSDVCCTSSNAVNIVKSIPNKRIIFVPDENLGNYVSKFVPEKEMIIFNGYCIVHKAIKPSDVIKAKEKKPNAKILMHPECTASCLELADFIGSTAQIIDYATKSSEKEFIIGTEQGVLHYLSNKNPDKSFYLLSPKLICSNMKKTTINDVLYSLEKMEHKIELDMGIIEKASVCLEKMLTIS